MSLSPLSYTVDEEDGQVTVTLVKSGETELPVEVLLSTLPGTASGRLNTAIPVYRFISFLGVHTETWYNPYL